VSPSDLGTYLNDASVQEDRAFLMIQLAQDLCESVLSPLPLAAKGIVLRIAARKYVSTTSTRAQQLASGGSPMGAGTLPDLTRADKADLRRLAGGGGAFSIDTLVNYTPPVLPIWEDGVPGFGFDTGTL
jgi:cell division inhibitor SulA